MLFFTEHGHFQWLINVLTYVSKQSKHDISNFKPPRSPHEGPQSLTGGFKRAFLRARGTHHAQWLHKSQGPQQGALHGGLQRLRGRVLQRTATVLRTYGSWCRGKML